MKEVHIAVDFGGGSGRVIAGYPAEGGLQLDTVYRFRNRQVRMGNHLYWDFLSLFEDMKAGLRMAVEKGYRILSIGVDTWGVDFGLIDKKGNLLGNPVCYRDSYTDGMPESFFQSTDAGAHYAESGTQVMAINSMFQLMALLKENDAALQAADKLLFMPDLFSYFLTGEVNNEYSIASTSELLDARKRTWNWKLIEQLGLSAHLFSEVVMPGTLRGMLKPDICRELGIDYEVPVVAVASHDTASAAYAAPVSEVTGTQAFLSSGTWSLLGVMLEEPILTEEARTGGFTNEGGVGGKICFLQNITGLWLLQRLMQEWEAEGKETSYEVLIPEAEIAEISSVIDVDDAVFQNPANMETAIREYCTAHGMQEPVSQAEFVRCIAQSLAERYRKGIELLNPMLPAPVSCLHIIGGGSLNRLLNQLTEHALGIPVTAGPVEATAIGNILVQMSALGK